MFEDNILILNGLVNKIKREEKEIKEDVLPLEFNRDYLLGLFEEFYKEHAQKVIKKAQRKVKNKVVTPLAEKKEKFLLEVLKCDKNVLSIASKRKVSLKKIAQKMRQSLEEFAKINEQLNLMVS